VLLRQRFTPEIVYPALVLWQLNRTAVPQYRIAPTADNGCGDAVDPNANQLGRRSYQADKKPLYVAPSRKPDLSVVNLPIIINNDARNQRNGVLFRQRFTLEIVYPALILWQLNRTAAPPHRIAPTADNGCGDAVDPNANQLGRRGYQTDKKPLHVAPSRKPDLSVVNLPVIINNDTRNRRNGVLLRQRFIPEIVYPALILWQLNRTTAPPHRIAPTADNGCGDAGDPNANQLGRRGCQADKKPLHVAPSRKPDLSVVNLPVIINNDTRHRRNGVLFRQRFTPEIAYPAFILWQLNRTATPPHRIAPTADNGCGDAVDPNANQLGRRSYQVDKKPLHVAPSRKPDLSVVNLPVIINNDARKQRNGVLFRQRFILEIVYPVLILWQLNRTAAPQYRIAPTADNGCGDAVDPNANQLGRRGCQADKKPLHVAPSRKPDLSVVNFPVIINNDTRHRRNGVWLHQRFTPEIGYPVLILWQLNRTAVPQYRIAPNADNGCGDAVDPNANQLGRRSYQADKKPLHVAPSRKPDLSVVNFPVIINNDTRNRRDGVLLRQKLLLVNVHLADLDFTRIILLYLFENRRQHLARSAPLSPEIKYHRNRRMYNFALKIFLCNLHNYLR
jgi:hypothetical protein